MPIDVIQSNPQLEQNRDGRFDPLVGGVAVGNARHNFLGTLGVVVFDARSGAAMASKNHHVLVAATGQAGDNVIQPAVNNPNNVVGTLTRWNVGLDCAVGTLNNSRAVSTAILDFPGGVRGPLEPTIGARVAKSGRTTATTRGIVDGVSATEFTIIPDPANPAPNGEISAGGDSGSVWLETATSMAVGCTSRVKPIPIPRRNVRGPSGWSTSSMPSTLARPSHVPVFAQGDPGNGIGGYDLRSPADRAFALDFDHSGKLDHVVLYRPGTGTMWILKNTNGTFAPVFAQGDPGKGIGGYDRSHQRTKPLRTISTTAASSITSSSIAQAPGRYGS